MIQIETHPEKNFVHAVPGDVLTSADLDKLRETIDNYINVHDKVPALLVETRELPHWDKFSTMLQHLSLVKSRHKLIRKVAIVSDSVVLQSLRPIADHFTKAKIRHFPSRHLIDAVEWCSTQEDHPGGFEILEHLPSNVIGIEAVGVITAQDYDEILKPLVAERLARHDHLNLLFVAGANFRACTAGAVWDDARFGLIHLTDFQKIAIVTDVDWLRMGAKFFAPLTPGQTHVFDLAAFDNARAWVSS